MTPPFHRGLLFSDNRIPSHSPVCHDIINEDLSPVFSMENCEAPLPIVCIWLQYWCEYGYILTILARWIGIFYDCLNPVFVTIIEIGFFGDPFNNYPQLFTRALAKHWIQSIVYWVTMIIGCKL